MVGQVRRASLITRNPEEGRAALERAYRRLRLDRPATTEDFELHLSAIEAHPLGIQQSRLVGFHGAGTNDGTGLIRIGHLTHGRFTLRTGRHEVAATAAFLFPSGPYTGAWADPALTTLTVQEAVVTHHARALVGREDFALAFTGHHPINAAMRTHWLATARHLAHNALPNNHVMASPLARDQLLRTMVTALLHTFPNTYLDQSAQAPPEAPAPAALRRAVAFIDTHLDTAIGLAEIAEAARLSPRAVQALFRRHLDTTPLHYLRTARLDAARADLLAADPTTRTRVAAVAARWGFTHPGRFAAAYQQAYGETPAATLHR